MFELDPNQGKQGELQGQGGLMWIKMLQLHANGFTQSKLVPNPEKQEPPEPLKS